MDMNEIILQSIYNTETGTKESQVAFQVISKIILYFI